MKGYGKVKEREIQDSQSGAEVLIYRYEELCDAVTLQILKHYSNKDTVIQELYKVVNNVSNFPKELAGCGYGDCLSQSLVF